MNHRGIPVGAASSNDRAPSTAMTDDQQNVVPAYPFVVVPSPSSLEVSSYDTSSGSPPSSRPSQSGVGSGSGAQSEWHMFLQQNNMTVNCDPVVIENFIKFRERAVVEAARVTVAATQAQASAVIATSEAQSQARVEMAQQTVNSVTTEASAYVRGIEGAAREHVAMTEVAAQNRVNHVEQEAASREIAAQTRVNHVEQEAASRVGQAVAAAQGAALSENNTRQLCEAQILQERVEAKLKQESLHAQVEKLQAVLEEMQNAQTDELREMQDQYESEIASLKREVPQTSALYAR